MIDLVRAQQIHKGLERRVDSDQACVPPLMSIAPTEPLPSSPTLVHKSQRLGDHLPNKGHFTSTGDEFIVGSRGSLLFREHSIVVVDVRLTAKGPLVFLSIPSSSSCSEA